MRSLMEPPGLLRSDLIQTWALVAKQALDAHMGCVADGVEDGVGFHADSKGCAVVLHCAEGIVLVWHKLGFET